MKKIMYLLAITILSVSILTKTAAAHPSRLETAIHHGDMNKLQKCIRNHDYLNVVNNNGKTPLDLARELQNSAMITLLQDHGAKRATDLSPEEQELSAQFLQHESIAQQVHREVLQLTEQLEQLLGIKLSISGSADSAE